MNDNLPPSKYSDIMVSMRDVRRYGMCVSGSKAFADRHNLDFKKFIKVGISVEELINTQDAMALSIVESKLKEINHGR